MLEHLDSPFSTQGGENLMAETISRKEAIAWLAGIIDGEGCIHAFWAKQQPHMTGPGMRINVLVGGCHPAMIARVTQVLKACGVGFCVQVFKPAGGRKPAAQVVIAGKGRVRKLLELVMIHLTEKRRQAELALELINYRESLAGGAIYGASRKDKIRLCDDPTIIGLIEEIRTAKNEFPNVLDFSRRPGEELGSQSSETIRHRLRDSEVMIESELHGDMQTMAETTMAQPEARLGVTD